MYLKSRYQSYFVFFLWFFVAYSSQSSFAATNKDYSLSLKLASNQSVRVSWKVSRSYAKQLKKICLQKQVNGRFISLGCSSPRVLSKTVIDTVIDEYDVQYRLVLTKNKSVVRVTKNISLPLPDDSSDGDSTDTGGDGGGGDGGGNNDEVNFQSACPPGFADIIIKDTNTVRQSLGLTTVIYNSRLAWGADMHSRFMAETQTLTHDGWSDRIMSAGYSFTSIGQNVAFTQGSSSDWNIVALWMASSGHRENIINPKWVHIGVSCAYSSNGFMYWTQNFGKP